MARPINVVPSFLLVLAGAWASSGRTALAFCHVGVWIVGFITASIAMASCIMNDYFDFTAGTDAINAPQKPLPAGKVPPELAVAVGAGSYICILLIAMLINDYRLRLIVAASSVLTLLYTPIFKKTGLLKNASVAAVITGAPLAGALAAGAPSLHALLKPCVFLFLSVTFREILMDINDVQGDAAAGIRTLPVLIGKTYALLIAVAALLLASGLLLFEAWTGDGAASVWAVLPRLEPAGRLFAAFLGLCIMSRPVVAAVELWRQDFPSTKVGAVVDDSLTSLGAGMLFLAVLG
jgi:geranylgeranylglycerol-phosphate geranylgeranyltransferase